ncbi:MAG TPA: CocE/NonD family hydrolase, partial [Candidatus Thermoplasmatota archaeon]|nr:CocE/NonD family hydrolase [Candidatus Thermoplasmatota archaeon]
MSGKGPGGPCVLALAALLAGCLTPAAVPEEVLRSAAVVLPVDDDGFVDLGFAGVLHLESDFPSPIGGIIHAEYYVPEGAGPDRPVPVIVEYSPYNAPGRHTDDGVGPFFGAVPDRVEEYVPRGTAVAYVDARGFAGSGGCWDYYGDDELADAVATVEWFATQEWSSGKVGMMGTSYPGTTQLLAAIGQAQGLVTIVPIAPEPSVYENQFKNGVQYRNAGITSSLIYASLYPGIALLPPGTEAGAYPGYAQARTETPKCLAESTPALLDPDAKYSAYFAERDRQGDAGRVTASVFWSHGFWDQNVKPDTFTPFWQEITAPKRAWFWHGYHQDPTEDATGRDGFYDQRHLWMDHWLHGAANGADTMAVVEVQDSLGRWRYEDTWPPADAAPRLFFPTSDGVLVDEPAAETVAFRTDQRTSFGEGSRTASPARVAADASHVAATDALAEPVHVAGVPLYHTRLSLDETRGQIVTGLFDVDPDGTWTLVDRGALDLRHRDGMDRVVPVVQGEAMDVTFDGWPTDWVFEAG